MTLVHSVITTGPTASIGKKVSQPATFIGITESLAKAYKILVDELSGGLIRLLVAMLGRNHMRSYTYRWCSTVTAIHVLTMTINWRLLAVRASLSSVRGLLEVACLLTA